MPTTSVKRITVHAAKGVRTEFSCRKPESSLHAMSRLQRCAVAFAIAPHAVQDRCLGPDACIHAFALTPSARDAPCRDAPCHATAMSCSPRPLPWPRCLHPCLALTPSARRCAMSRCAMSRYRFFHASRPRCGFRSPLQELDFERLAANHALHAAILASTHMPDFLLIRSGPNRRCAPASRRSSCLISVTLCLFINENVRKSRPAGKNLLELNRTIGLLKCKA